MTKLLLSLVLSFALASCSPPSTHSPPKTTSHPTIEPPQQVARGEPTFVEADGKQFVLRCFGEGAPSVILENGYGVDWTEWKEVIAGIQDQTQICAYDRVTPATTSSEAADDLHAMLKSAGVTPPYVLAGHSLGGFTVVLFASRHPKDVAGIALIDSSHPDQDARALELLPPPSATEGQALKDLRAGLEASMIGIFDWRASTDQVRAVGSLGSIPLSVVEASPYNTQGLDAIGNDDLVRQLAAVKHALQVDHDRLSTNSTHFTSEHSGHMVPIEDPELVIAAILSLIPDAYGG